MKQVISFSFKKIDKREIWFENIKYITKKKTFKRENLWSFFLYCFMKGGYKRKRSIDFNVFLIKGPVLSWYNFKIFKEEFIAS